MDVPLTVRDSGWLALHIGLTTEKNELGHPLFAHTSPIYVQVAGRPIFRAEAAEALRRDIEASIDTVRARGTFKDDAEREGVLDVYRRAIEGLVRRRADLSK